MSDLPPLKIRVAGVSFDNRDGSPRQPFVKATEKGHPLRLRREPDNPFDGNAIAVDWADSAGDYHQLGYVPRNLASVLAPMADEGAFLSATVIRKGRARPGPGKPAWYGVRMSIEGDLSALAAHWRSGMEPMIAAALALPEDEAVESLAPMLGGLGRAI